MPMSMPTIRETTTKRGGDAVHVVVGEREQGGVDRREREAEAEPADDERDVGDRLLERGQPPAGHQHEPGRRHQHPDRRDDAGGEEADQVAARDRADRQGDQEAHQHERGGQLVVGVDGRPREERDVDERGDEAAPTKKLTSSAPHAGVRRERAARHQRVRGAAYVPGERGGGDDRAEEVPPAARREDLDLGVGGCERQDHAAEREGEEQGADEVGVDRARAPSRAGRAAGAGRTSTRRAAAPAPRR